MTIKLKLLLIATGVAIVMLLSIAAMKWSVATLNSLNETQIINHQIFSDMLMLRRNEKDFLLRNDLKYLDKFNQNHVLMQDDISKLSELLDSNDISIEGYDSLSTIMNNYQARFHQLVDITRQIGLNPKAGLRGTLRNSVHKAEAIFKEISNYKLFKEMLMLRRNEKDFIMRKDNKYTDKFHKNFLIFIDSIKNSDIDNSRKTLLLSDVEAYKKDFLQLTALMEKKGFDPKSGILGEMRNTVHQSEDLLKKTHDIVEQGIQSTSASIQMVNLIASLLVAALVVGFTFFLAQSISRSLAEFIKTLQDICDTGNLTLRVEDHNKDEISQVGSTLNRMLTEFQEIVQHQHIASANLNEYSQQFMSIRENTFKNVEKQQLETEQVNTAMKAMTASAKNIAQNTTQTAEASLQANSITKQGKIIVDDTIQTTQSLEQVISNASIVIQQLGDNSKSIGGILDVIRGIAEQTNLLALNAAIEAARAGEQGRGFAVVADEVRSLAQKTQDSISEIESMITSLQTGSVKAINAITQGKEGVSNNVEQISNAGSSLAEIVSELNAINQMSHENASATEEQSAVSEEVNKNVLTIKDLGSLIVGNIEQLKQYSDKMASLSTEMTDLVKRFQV